jgi:hypothetical protein
MRWSIAAACLGTFALGVVILVATPGFERLPPGGRAIPYLGMVLVGGYVGVGSFAALRRPDNRTGVLMIAVGIGFALSGLQLFDVAWLWAIGSLVDTMTVALLVHLLLAFPSGRLEARGERRAAVLAYAAGALQPLVVVFSTCAGEHCPSNPILIADDETIAGLIQIVQVAFSVIAVGATVVCCCAVGACRIRRSAAASNPCCCWARRSGFSAS